MDQLKEKHETNTKKTNKQTNKQTELVQSGASADQAHQRSTMGRNCQFTIELREFGNNTTVRGKCLSVQILRDRKENHTDQLEKSNMFGLCCLEILRNDKTVKCERLINQSNTLAHFTPRKFCWTFLTGRLTLKRIAKLRKVTLCCEAGFYMIADDRGSRIEDRKMFRNRLLSYGNTLLRSSPILRSSAINSVAH